MTEQTTMSPEEVAAQTGGQVVKDEWDSGENIPSAWFKFETVGDFIKGTLVGKSIKKSSNPTYDDQWVYELKTSTGVTKVGMAVKAREFINNKMKYVAIGQVVGFKYLKDVPSEKFKGKFAKSLDVKVFGLDPDYVDQGEEVKIDNIPFD